MEPGAPSQSSGHGSSLHAKLSAFIPLHHERGRRSKWEGRTTPSRATDSGSERAVTEFKKNNKPKITGNTDMPSLQNEEQLEVLIICFSAQSRQLCGWVLETL